MKDKKIKVFYDGSCKVCSKEINFYDKHDKKNKFNWIDLNSKNKDLQSLGINKNKLLESLHIQMQDGRIVKGVNAFKVIWREYPYLKFISYVLDFRIMRIIARPIYKILVKIKSLVF
tara:strand:+ start:33 stop:383 length:351 start_codon:yes stop_codon:yes gene_type:complete